MRSVIREIARRASDADVAPITYLLNNYSEEELRDLQNVISQELDARQMQADAGATEYNEPDVGEEPADLSDIEVDCLMNDIFMELGYWLSQETEQMISSEEMVAA